jgi:hypothetical protein
MLVKFDPSIGVGTDHRLRAYNFMRCVDAVVTAAANSTPSVNPLTAANTYNTGLNCITSVIANAEAGGWTRSSSYNLVDASYDPANVYNRVYYADYYNTTGKSDYPYKKFTLMPQPDYSWDTRPTLCVQYGPHTATTRDGAYSNETNSSYLGRSYSDYYSGYYNGGAVHGGLRLDLSSSTFTNGPNISIPGMEYTIAATQDYIIIANPLYYMIYAGTRATQTWENSLSNNPPMVGFSTFVDYRYIEQPAWSINQRYFWGILQDGVGTPRTTPSKVWNNNLGSIAYNYTAYNPVSPWHGGSNVGINGAQVMGNELGQPIMYTRTASNQFGGSPGIQINPVVDSSGTYVPCAIPINFMVSDTSTVTNYTYANKGGKALGIFKSISGPDTWMSNYYTANQIFTVDGDPYWPFVCNGDLVVRDMFLLRAR